MEPCRTTVKGRRLHRPFAVVPFLYYYNTDELAHFIRTHLDPPFNERFSKFIQVVRMKGIDYVRLSSKDIERLCDGEGDHQHDLQILQTALYKPKRKPRSPHVRDIFSLPSLDLTFAPQSAPSDIFGSYTAELTFDYPSDDEVEPVFECIIPLPTTPSPQRPVELPEYGEGSSIQSSFASSPTDDGDDEESLIDMFSPVSPSSDHSSDLSSWSAGPDIFDDEHLESLCSPPSSPLYDPDDDVDILGLLPQDKQSSDQDKSEEISPTPGHTEMESGSDVSNSEGAESGHGVAQSPSAEEGISVHEDATSRLLSTTPCVVPVQIPSAPAFPTSAPLPVRELFSYVDNEDRETLGDNPESPSSLPRDILLHSSSTLASPHSVTSSELPLPGPESIPESSTYGEAHEVDIDDLRTAEDGLGLSSFLPELRSLDFSPPASPRLDAFSGCDSLSFGFSASPGLSAIDTPFTSVIGDDTLVAGSPSTSYRGPHDHLPDFFSDPQCITAKRLDLTLRLEQASTRAQPEQDGSAAKRPHLEVTIPPPLLEDAQLTSLMSSVELTKVKSQGWSSLVPPSPVPPISRSSSIGSDRSIFPVRSTWTVGRYLTSPHMKEPSKPSAAPEGGQNEAEEPRRGSSRPSLKTEREMDDPLQPRPVQESPPALQPSKFPMSPTSPQRWTPDTPSVLGRMGGFLRTILSPVEPGDQGENRFMTLAGGLRVS